MSKQISKPLEKEFKICIVLVFVLPLINYLIFMNHFEQVLHF